jgi:hypothetical protein
MPDGNMPSGMVIRTETAFIRTTPYAATERPGER